MAKETTYGKARFDRRTEWQYGIHWKEFWRNMEVLEGTRYITSNCLDQRALDVHWENPNGY